MADIIKTIETDAISVITYLKTGLFSVLLIIAGIFGLEIISNIFPMFSAFPAILANLGFGIGLFYVVDRWVLKDVNMPKTLKENPMTLGAFILGFLIIIAASIIAS